MSIMMYMLRHGIKQSPYAPRAISEIFGEPTKGKVINVMFSVEPEVAQRASSSDDKPISPRMKEFQQKLREKTPIGKLDQAEGKHPYQEKEPLEGWPDNTNPNTGEVGGPRGPEPTRYGDWERKGRVTDF